MIAEEYLRNIRETSERYAFLGDAWELKGDLTKAEEAWRKSVELDPDQARAREGLARVAMEENQPTQAIEWLRPMSEGSKLTSSIAHVLKRASGQLGEIGRAHV